MPISLKNFSELVSEINNAATGLSRWEPVLTKIATASGCDSVGLLTADSHASHLQPAYVGVDYKVIAGYNEYYHRIDPIAEAMRRKGWDGIWCNDELVPWTINSRTELYTDWAAPNGLNDGVFACFNDPMVGATALCITRQRRTDTYPIKCLLRLLKPHLLHAVHIQARLVEHGGLGAKSFEALNLISHGIVLLDEAGKVSFSNTAANRNFHDTGGLEVGRDHRLRAALPADDSNLQKIVGRASKGIDGFKPGGSTAISRSNGQRAVLVHVLPLKEGYAGQTGAIVIVVDPERQPEPSTRFLQRTFKLTQAEAEVAQLIMEGEGLRYVADKLAVSLPTVRTHLQHVFDKTGVHRQAALIRLLSAAHGALTISVQ